MHLVWIDVWVCCVVQINPMLWGSNVGMFGPHNKDNKTWFFLPCGNHFLISMRKQAYKLDKMQKVFCRLGDRIYSLYSIKIIMSMQSPYKKENPTVYVCHIITYGLILLHLKHSFITHRRVIIHILHPAHESPWVLPAQHPVHLLQRPPKLY